MPANPPPDLPRPPARRARPEPATPAGLPRPRSAPGAGRPALLCPAGCSVRPGLTTLGGSRTLRERGSPQPAPALRSAWPPRCRLRSSRARCRPSSQSAPFRVHFWFLGYKSAPLSRVFATGSFHCTRKAAICCPSLPPTCLSLPNVRYQSRRMAAQPDYLSEWLSSRRVPFSTALDGSDRAADFIPMADGAAGLCPHGRPRRPRPARLWRPGTLLGLVWPKPAAARPRARPAN